MGERLGERLGERAKGAGVGVVSAAVHAQTLAQNEQALQRKGCMCRPGHFQGGHHGREKGTGIAGAHLQGAGVQQKRSDHPDLSVDGSPCPSHQVRVSAQGWRDNQSVMYCF
jgi:hypothetical protein